MVATQWIYICTHTRYRFFSTDEKTCFPSETAERYWAVAVLVQRLHVLAPPRCMRSVSTWSGKETMSTIHNSLVSSLSQCTLPHLSFSLRSTQVLLRASTVYDVDFYNSRPRKERECRLRVMMQLCEILCEKDPPPHRLYAVANRREV